MRVAALITAAGLSSRMGQFKPMLNVGEMSVAQRVVSTFRQAGVDTVVMVTGHNADVLETHLDGNGIVFLRNEKYASTQMLDSIKIGLEYLRGKCDAVLFTPVDISLFKVSTVLALTGCGMAPACPVCEGNTGHPILLGSEMLPKILAYNGERGLMGAIESMGAEFFRVEVDDMWMLMDADTPEEYSALLNKYYGEKSDEKKDN